MLSRVSKLGHQVILGSALCVPAFIYLFVIGRRAGSQAGRKEVRNGAAVSALGASTSLQGLHALCCLHNLGQQGAVPDTCYCVCIYNHMVDTF